MEADAICQSSNLFYTNVEDLQQCSNLEQIADTCYNVFHGLGYPAFKYAWIPPAFYGREQNWLFLSRPSFSTSAHTLAQLLRNDPKIRYCGHNLRPAVWASGVVDEFLDREAHIHDEVRGFWGKAFAMGMSSLVTIPLRGIGGSVGMLSLVNTERRTISFPFLEAWAHYMQNAVESLYAHEQVSEDLSRREVEVIRWTMLGKTASEISMIMTISDNTVLFHLKNIKRKLNVSNKYHMVAKALTLGLLNPQ